jgi:hypothetical protein
MMTASEFVKKAEDIASEYKTLYVMGCFGSPMTPSNKIKFTHNHEYNKRANRTQMINSVTPDYFGFDCSGLIKGILWGWNGDRNDPNGGAVYASTTPDLNADTMIKYCEASSDFSKIIPGELLWTDGHIGIYIGNGLAVECTPSFANKVQVTVVKNIKGATVNSRFWKKHGKFKYIKYDNSSSSDNSSKADPLKTTTDIAKEVIEGKWGVMPERKQRIIQAGYNYDSVRTIVNRLIKEGK